MSPSRLSTFHREALADAACSAACQTLLYHTALVLDLGQTAWSEGPVAAAYQTAEDPSGSSWYVAVCSLVRALMEAAGADKTP